MLFCFENVKLKRNRKNIKMDNGKNNKITQHDDKWEITPETTAEEIRGNLGEYLSHDISLSSDLLTSVLKEVLDNDGPEALKKIFFSEGVKEEIIRMGGAKHILEMGKRINSFEPIEEEEDDAEVEVDLESIDSREKMMKLAHFDTSPRELVDFALRDEEFMGDVCDDDYREMRKYTEKYGDDAAEKKYGGFEVNAYTTMRLYDILIRENTSFENRGRHDFENLWGIERLSKGYMKHYIEAFKDSYEEKLKEGENEVEYAKKLEAMKVLANGVAERGYDAMWHFAFNKTDEDITEIARDHFNTFMFYQEGTIVSGGFVGFRDPSYDNGYNFTKDKIEARLYLSPSDDNVALLTWEIISKCHNEKDMSFELKVAECDDRNDKIVLYTDYKNIGKYLEILREIKDEKPELFENMGKNKLWGTIDGAPEGVYFGEEPDEDRTSYSSKRAHEIGLSIMNWCDHKEEFDGLSEEELKDRMRNLSESDRQDLARHLEKDMSGAGSYDKFCFNS